MRSIHSLEVTMLSFLALLHGIQALPNPPCPLLNAYYPSPINLTTSDRIGFAAAGSETQLVQALRNGSAFGQLDPNMTTFSVDVYSLHSEESLFTYHYTPELLSSLGTSGVSVVDSKSVFRVGSVSKLWTVFLYLIEAGDDSWNRPITDFVPELAAITERKPSSEDQVDNVSWESITVGALASQMSGIGRDSAYSAELAGGLESLGLTNQGGNIHSACGDPARTMLPCNRTAFFEDFSFQHPVTESWLTPVYSNTNYQILSYALENITGKTMEDIFTHSLVQRLDLNGTYYATPATMDSSFIPINSTISWWDGNTLDETPAGGYYSNINDMRTIGKAMLNSTLLSPVQTRRWMKPSAFTSNPDFAVGAPWEIMRAPGSPVSWMYTKSGDLGMYSALVGLMPDLGLGFSVLSAGASTTAQVATVASTVSAQFVPALWDQAKDETSEIYGGTYTDESTNSTFVVSVASDSPGLLVEEFTIGGEDVTSLLGSMLGSSLTVRLYPMGLSQAGIDDSTTVSWRAIFETAALQSASTPSRSCVSWQLVNQYLYGGVGLDEFLFLLDPSGHSAISLESRIVGVSELKSGNSTVSSRRLLRH